MDIKATKKIIVGTNSVPLKVGEVALGVDDAEAKALIAVGYASEATDGDITKRSGKSKANAPENKSADPLADVLAGTVDEVVGKLDTFSADELRQLRDLEAAGQNRKGIASAIAEYDLGE